MCGAREARAPRGQVSTVAGYGSRHDTVFSRWREAETLVCASIVEMDRADFYDLPTLKWAESEIEPLPVQDLKTVLQELAH